jgi:hypothetical protein
MRAVSIILTGIFVANAAPIYDPFAFSDAELDPEEHITDDLLFGYNDPYADGLSTDGLYTDDPSLFGSAGLDSPYLVAVTPKEEGDDWPNWTDPNDSSWSGDKSPPFYSGGYRFPEEESEESEETSQTINPDPNAPTSFELHPDQADAIVEGTVKGATWVWNGVTWVYGVGKSAVDAVGDWVPAPAGF